MQITSGMAGAFGQASGSLDPTMQSSIASDYVYNIAFGARMLAEKWAAVPRIGNGDPTVVENWYYALWAYNGWGWVNNPNNPRFTRLGTPATNPSTYPYQERVLYLVAHPPKDRDGNPLWKPVAVTLPPAKAVGKSPGTLPAIKHSHSQPPPPLSAVYRPAHPAPVESGADQRVRVTVTNTGTEPWGASEPMSLTYHLLTLSANPWQPLSPFSTGMIAFGQGSVPLTGVVLPGRSRTVMIDVQAPDSPGTYLLAWDLASPGAWLSGEGTLPRVQRLTVAAGDRPVPTPTPKPPTKPAPALSLRYVADTSFPDGSSVGSGKPFTKGWLVFNAGKAPWTNGMSLKLASGKPFGARLIRLPLTEPCRSVNLLVRMKAPGRAGSYKSVWQLRDASGVRVGDPITLVITVRGKPAPRPTATPVAATPTPTPQPRPTQSPTPAG